MISAITTLFRRSRQISYLLRSFEFGYNHFGYTVTSPIATLFVGPRRIYCSFITGVRNIFAITGLIAGGRQNQLILS